MDNFQLFKLKKAGLTNLNILKIIEYQKTKKKSLSLRDMAVVSGCREPLLFMEQYKNLNSSVLRKEFNRFSSLSIFDKDYPLELKNIYNPPALLFYKGNIDLLQSKKLAIVGSRSSSQNGIDAVKKIVQELGNRFVIVSGLARGIDTSAHLAVLRNGGSSIAVIGTGLDMYYPKENKQLQDYIAHNHLLLSEYGPGSRPLKYHFPERNRIIAGLSQGVVVAEAKLRSGSLITSERALEEGRDVYAIPGNILDGYSDGCHHLIQEGAKCITSGLDILNEY
ncbi:DNA-processing protein DprA [Streptococcus macacae]|uniref:DNA protecting protein DprA n=1 Tax=Streptococcus macacae NCTC 11558 TaxID=764298 RepID=G5JU84_9STRE|nr:DNA-processing protein DprA [Streptococcus macacae]EHJ52812.1 DNA protecting protein DprA [Streptococcus macacae NCTC 11558]SUN78449.1 DNA processing Smf protein [Streptococcus macacae NCTC 11558]